MGTVAAEGVVTEVTTLMLVDHSEWAFIPSQVARTVDEGTLFGHTNRLARPIMHLSENVSLSRNGCCVEGQCYGFIFVS